MDEIRKESKSLPNRVRSIVHDSQFVNFIAERIPQLPVIPNERAGSWYVNPRLQSHGKSVYFKSTDGHFGQWDFNLKRMNYHILKFIGENDGAIIVDITRKGKRFPDSLSKTIPIWCTVINHAIKTLSGNSEWDCTLYTSRASVSESEESQIAERIPGFVESLLNSSINLENLPKYIKKPLRPIWIHPSTRMLTTDTDTLFWTADEFGQLTFCPIICLSASISTSQDILQDEEPLFPVQNAHLYVQGAADDSEMWAPEVTFKHFWTAVEQITPLTSDSRIDEIFALVKSNVYSPSNLHDYDWIGDTGIAIGNRASANPDVCWDYFDFIINCGAPTYEYGSKSSYLYLDIPEGKKGQNQLMKYVSAKDSLIEKLESLGHERMVVLFFGSQTGTAEDLATRTMKTISNKLHIPGVVIDTDEYNMEELAELNDLGKDWLYGFFMATYGEGEPTDNSADFYSWIMDGNGVGSDKGDQEDHMTEEQICNGLNYIIFGLGNKTYEHFNAIAKRLDARLTKLGAKRVGPRGEGDDDDSMEGDYLKWEPQILTAISEYFGVAVDTTSQKSKPHVPLFKIEYVDSEPKFKGELSSGQPRTWNNTIENNAKSSYDIKHPYYSEFVVSEPLFKNASDSFKFPGHEVKISHSKVAVKDEHLTIPRQCYHIEFDLGNSGIKYKTGDHIGVYGNNSVESVEYLAKGLKIDNLDKVIKLVPNPDNPLSASAKSHLPMPCTLRTALTNYLDINAITKQHQLEIFAKYAKDAAEKKLLEELSDKREKYVAEVETQQKTLADILHEFPSVELPLSVALGGILRPIAIRYYSISSSSKESPSVVSVTAVVVRYALPHKHLNNGSKKVVIKDGLVTSFLERIHDHKEGRIESKAIPASEHIPKFHFPVYIRSSNFRLPKNLETPVVMVGPGTGVAPFRGFVRERFLHAQEGEKVGPTWLFYGCRNADSDFLYKEEFEQMLKEAADLDIELKIITAFSRDTDKKVYVQHRVKEHASDIWKFLETQNGSFYICGDAKNMAHDVNKELENIAMNIGGMDEEGSKNWIKKLRTQGRYLEDVWS
ncbi:hypothetical protein HDV06_004129 [Boothiomyces sp. JEL0866]|nr:hypothetical protein HDV06_004129 [Boothiomyces sp. JEL0866]